MTRVAELATVVVDGLKDTETVEGRAHLVWNALVRDARKITWDGHSDYADYDGNIRSVIEKLFPQLHALETDVSDEIRREIYQYLRQTAQALCISRRPGHVRWSVKRTWDVAPGTELVVIPDKRAILKTRTKTKKDTMTAKSKLAADTKDKILAALAEAKKPISPRELARSLELHDGTIRTALQEFVDAGLIFSRQLTPEEYAGRLGRRPFVYSSDPVIPPVKPEDILPPTERAVARALTPAQQAQRGTTQGRVLSMLSEHRGHTVSEICAKTGLSDSHARQILKRLLELGVIRRTTRRMGNGRFVTYLKATPRHPANGTGSHSFSYDPSKELVSQAPTTSATSTLTVTTPLPSIKLASNMTDLDHVTALARRLGIELPSAERVTELEKLLETVTAQRDSLQVRLDNITAALG